MKKIVRFIDAVKMCSPENEWFHCRKKPIIVSAIQMEEDFVVETLEGEVKGKAGDYLLKGIKEEVYPCRRDIFEESYERVK